MLLSSCVFRKNCFRKVFLINFVSTWNNLLKHCIFDTLLLMEGYVQGALRNELLIIAPFVGRRFGKVSLETFTNTSNKMPNHCIFAEFFLIVGWVQGSLRNELPIVHFVVCFKKAILGKSYREILSVLGTIYLNIAFLLFFADSILSTKCSKKRTAHCFFRRAH